MKEWQYYLIVGLSDGKGKVFSHSYRPGAQDWVSEKSKDAWLEYNEVSSSWDAILRDDDKMIPPHIHTIGIAVVNCLVDDKGAILKEEPPKIIARCYQHKQYHK